MPSISRVHVTRAKGIHFNSMGHSVARENTLEKSIKRLELLPEEALYLVERGTLLCHRDLGTISTLQQDEENLPILSVQQAFAEMIGAEGITLEKYQVGSLRLNSSYWRLTSYLQVYAYLKRLGYAVMRHKSPPTSPYYPLPPPYSPPRTLRSNWLQRCIGRIHMVFSWFISSSRPWTPARLRWHHSPGTR
jgi:tRNA-splicing endonuclease subunit Sen54